MKRILIILAVMALSLSCASADAPSFEQLADLDWFFESGVGGWSTELDIDTDGSFCGYYHDSEMGEAGEAYPDGTVYYCTFSGKMSLQEQVDEYTWNVKIDSLTAEGIQGEESVEEGVHFVRAEPYGISEGDTMRLYLPGAPVDGFTEDMCMWAHLLEMEQLPATLENWFLYSDKNGSGFVGISLGENSIGLANPWRDLTAEELQQVSGLTFGVPEGATDVIYRWLESEGLAEMQFSLGSDDCCARIQPAALREGELMNIADIYTPWDAEEETTVGTCYGTVSIARTGSEDRVVLCLWYDAAPGLMYSLSVGTTDPDGLDITALAEQVYVPVQGEN